MQKCFPVDPATSHAQKQQQQREAATSQKIHPSRPVGAAGGTTDFPILLSGIPPPPPYTALSPPSSFASSSPEEHDSYPSKFLELQRQIQLLESQLQKKIRRSASSNSDQETVILNEKISRLQGALLECQTKLADLGHPLNFSQSLVENSDKKLPPPGDPDYYNQLSKLGAEHKQTIPTKPIMAMTTETCQAELKQMREQLCQHQLMAGSSTDKDAEIARLNRLVSQMQVSTSVKEMELKQKLSQLSALCQDVVSKLSQGGAYPTTTSAQMAELLPNMQQQLQLGASKDPEAKRLEEELHKVVEMNTKWQKYNEQREAYIKQVQERAKLLEQQVRESSTVAIGASGFNVEQASQTGLKKIEEENVKLHETIGNLQQENERLKRENTVVQRENEMLRGQIVETAPGAPGASSISDKDTIAVLEQQVEILTEDFRSERSDRERAQSRIAELQQELNVVKRQLQQYQTEQMHDIHHRRAEALQQYQNEYNERRREHRGGSRNHANFGGLTARGLTECDTVEDGPLTPPPNGQQDEGMDTVDFGPITSYPPVPVHLVARGGGSPHTGATKSFFESDSAHHSPPPKRSLFDDGLEAEDMLQCPKCEMEFPVSRHQDLLEHTENCV